MKKLTRAAMACLGIAMLMAAIGVTTASASSLLSPETTPTKLLAASTSPGFTFGTTHISCEGNALEASIPTGHVIQDIDALPGAYTACGFFGLQTIQPNGCHYVFHPGAETSPGHFGGTVDLGTTGCGPITMKYSLGSCTLSITPKSGLPVSYENIGTGSKATVKITLSASGLKYADTCGLIGSGEDGKYNTSWTFHGSNPEDVQASIHLQQPVLFIEGKESSEAAKQPRFNSEFFPIGLLGTGTFKFQANGQEASCGTSEYRGATLVPTSSKTLTAAYPFCNAFSFVSKNSVVMNSCQMLFSIANTNAPYGGAVNLQCEKSGDAMQFIPKFLGYPVCTVSLPEQKLASVSYANAGSGSSRHVEATLSGEGIKYEEAAEGACGLGSGSNGKISASVNLTAIDH